MHRYTLVLDSYLELERDIGMDVSCGRSEIRQLGFAPVAESRARVCCYTPGRMPYPGTGKVVYLESLSGCSVHLLTRRRGANEAPTAYTMQ